MLPVIMHLSWAAVHSLVIVSLLSVSMVYNVSERSQQSKFRHYAAEVLLLTLILPYLVSDYTVNWCDKLVFSFIRLY